MNKTKPLLYGVSVLVREERYFRGERDFKIHSSLCILVV